MQKCNLPKGALCFKVTDARLYGLKDEVTHFVNEVRAHGCYFALGGFGRAGVSFKAQQGLQFDFLKIDGSIILSIMKNPMDAAKVGAITRVARSLGEKAVAELVETDECVQKLRELGVDFAQGLVISSPHPVKLQT